ncbi:pseudouridine synthase [Rhizoctonia solani]|nr:pseudouridine synthase [Rhizoctonia solani]
MASVKPKLEDLSKEQLIARIYELERQLPPQSRRLPQTVQNPFPFSQHPTRKIALKFIYAGWLYNGLAAQSHPTPLATVEQVLFDALVNTRLVDPAQGMEGCGWSRCGRTDRGVSSAGQVVSLWVRSALGMGSIRKKNESVFEQEDSKLAPGPQEDPIPILEDLDTLPSPETKQVKMETKQELAYIHMLNRVLPPSIRVLAWSPVADDFDARFSCQWRHYKYFFSRGGRALDGLAAAAGLDISAMRDAASRLIGEHDFRNFCKLDPSKQIENFNRRVLGAWIERIATDSQEGLYVFNLKGTAFLWHQVRCIMAVLFLVGQRLEHSSIIDHLLHTSHSSSKSLTSAPIESKPNYTLADSLPLVLWDCGYRPEDVTWQTDPIAQTKQGVTQDLERTNNFWFNMYSIWTHDRIQTTMQMYFLRAAERFYPTPLPSVDRGLVRLNMGGGVYRHTTRYISIHDLERGERAEIANAKWREGASGQRRITKRNSKAKNTDDG